VTRAEADPLRVTSAFVTYGPVSSGPRPSMALFAADVLMAR
jgi:hypothetical protein